MPDALPGGDAVTYREVDGVALLTLNEPKSMNALSASIKAALAAAIDRAMASETVRCLLLTGSGNAFCAGGDIRAMSQREPMAVRERLNAAYRWVRQLTQGDKPVVGAVNGVAAGAGLSLALMCDVVLASEEAVFKSGFSGLGAVPDLGLGYLLPRAVGLAMAKDLLLTGRALQAREALACGLVSRVVPHAELPEAALEAARGIAAGPVSLQLTRELLNQGLDCSFEAFLGHEALAQAAAFGTRDFDEGVKAFLDRRTPAFTGH